MSNTPMTIPELLARAFDSTPEKEGLVMTQGSWTYAEIEEEVARRVPALAERGVNQGTRVALVLGNHSEFVFTWFAVNWLGAITVPTNPDLPRSELLAHLQRARAEFVVTHAEYEQLMTELRPEQPFELVLAGYGHALSAGLPPSPASPNDVCVMTSTSGSSGVPKLVEQTHQGFSTAGRGFPFWLGLDSRDRLLTAMPLFHGHAQCYTVLGAVAAGATAIVLDRFSARSFLDSVIDSKATQISVVGAMLEILLRQPESLREREHAVHLCYTAPALPEVRHMEAKRRFGFALTAGYAQSESPLGMIWPIGTEPVGALGVLRQDPDFGDVNEARVVDEAGTDVPVGETGELWLRNPAIMRGYFDDPQATDDTVIDGWLHTGDLVQLGDDGLYRFEGRLRDLVRRRGQNIAATQVENVVSEHPGVSLCAVVGVPSELSDEEVKVFVVPRQGRDLDPADLVAWCADRLAGYKVPRYVEVVESLPQTPTNKIAKSALPRRLTGAEFDREGSHR